MDAERKRKLMSFVLYVSAYEKYLTLIDVCNKMVKKSRKKKHKSRSRIWRLPVYTENERELHGFFSQLFTYMKNDNEVEFRKATRMGVPTFKLLLNLLKERITKKDYVRASIPAECRLAITLVYLSLGTNRQSLAWLFRVGVSTVSKIIYETCDAIWDELCCIYLHPPNDGEWGRISSQFLAKTGMPHVLGAIDGKHISIKCPPRSGSQYYNYKQYFSIVLLAACDSDYTFIAVDVGAYGSQSDGGILEKSCFGRKILEDSICTLTPKKAGNSNIVLPFYFIGDAAFPLRTNIMRPYPGRILPDDKTNFNKRLSRARVRIENTFGILTCKWRVLTNQLNMLPKHAEKIVKATVILHNFVKFHETEQYCPDYYVDSYTSTGDIVEGMWRQEVQPLRPISNLRNPNSSRLAFSIRDTVKEYLKEN